MRIDLNLKVHYPKYNQAFYGKKGKEFISKNITRPGYWDKTNVLVNKIKNEFGFKSEKTNDILEAFVDEVKNLRLALYESEEEIEKLKKNNRWLNNINRRFASDLEEKNSEVSNLRYYNHLLRR